ncbi:hypothetical protein AB7W88_12295 [Providencia vermicola]|uniref:hypothetical protein n=1 Tax=Providencia TaxID=586 RepID=UPI0012B5F504|nr:MULTISPECIES: hypothetical protein [unclassified Providencia]MTB38805.1 hypothetical protein [Providencia sp. wls1949]MTC06745.1 hypothetical protein [Providencia sp. wls1948]
MLTYRNIVCFTLSLGLLSPIALANSHTVTVFQCVNKNQKKVNVSLVNGQYIYQFGKLNQTPDISMERKPEQLVARYFNPKGADTDTGTAQIYEMDFRNGHYTYTISSAYLGTKHEAEVNVYQKDKFLTSISCLPNTIVDNLSEHIFDLPSDN